MTIYFSRIEVSRRAMGNHRMRRELASGYGQHQLIWQAMRGDDPDRKRDFVYRLETSEGAPVLALPRFYVLGPRQPANLGGNLRVETKPYAPALCAGDVLAFRLRANACRSVWQRLR